MDEKETSVIVAELLKDRKRDRRWRMLRFGVVLLLIIVYVVWLSMHMKSSEPGISDASQPYVSLVHLDGEIMAGRPFSAIRVEPVLLKAFEDTDAKGVLLEINSPGGSPVQASMIHDYILYLKKKYKKKVVVLGGDALASGAYLVATAADRIYVHPDTLTGSIGVIMAGFGFTGAMEKIGVTRRVYTAGSHKDRMDPFSKLTPQDVTKINSVLGQVHQHFIADVKASRHDLKGDPKELFSGDFWTGAQAVEIGLVDGTLDRWQLLPQVFGVHQYKSYKVQSSFFRGLLGGASTMLPLHLVMNHAELSETLPD